MTLSTQADHIRSHIFFSLVAVFFLVILSPGSVDALDLIQAYELGLEQDPRYQKQLAQLSIIEERRFQAHAQAYKPTLAISANIKRNFQDIELSRSFGQDGRTNFTDKAYSLDLNQPIFHYDRHIQLDQADLDIQKAQYELDAAHQDLILRVAQAYFGVLIAREELKFSLAEEEALSRQRDQTEERFDVGLLAITDLQEAQAGADLAVARRLQAENTLDDAREALREIIGQASVPSNNGDDWPDLSAEFRAVAPEPENLTDWQQTSTRQNLTLQATLLAADIANLEIDQQKAGHLPSLDLVASHGFRENGGMFGSTETDFSLIGLEARVPLYEGGQVNSRSREALHLHEQALDDVIQSQRQVERQCREAYYGVMTGIRLINALEKAVESSLTAVEATKTGYEVGTRTAVDVVKADQELSRTRKDYSQAKYQYILDTLRLKMAAGSLEPEDLRRISKLLK